MFVFMFTAITEGRGKARGEVGIAAIDVYRPNLILSQISDCQTYSKSLAKICIFNPVEVCIFIFSINLHFKYINNCFLNRFCCQTPFVTGLPTQSCLKASKSSIPTLQSQLCSGGTSVIPEDWSRSKISVFLDTPVLRF